MKIKILTFIGLLSLATIMCGPSLNTIYFTETEPDRKELVGKYYPTAETINLIREDGTYEISEKEEMVISIMTDGTFEMTNMPDWWLTNFGIPTGGFDSGKGQWHIVQQQSWWNVALKFESRENFSSKPGSGSLSTSIPIVGNEAPYSLWLYIGDPDSGTVMVFEQISDE